LLDGIVEGWGFDGRHSFERKFNADPNGYFGSNSHEYVREQWFKKDFYHNAEDLRVGAYIIGGMLIGAACLIKKKKFWGYVKQYAIAWSVKAITKNIGLRWVRN